MRSPRPPKLPISKALSGRRLVRPAAHLPSPAELARARRRLFLRQSLSAMGVVAIAPALVRCTTDEKLAPVGAKSNLFPPYNPPSISVPSVSNIRNLGPLGEPNEDGLRLPEGFSARIIGRSGEKVQGTEYVWHPAPDGGATFLAEDGGWVYVSNSEALIGGSDGFHGGGVGAIRFDEAGNIQDAYSILTETAINCAGGPTPWGTWLSCEEFAEGQVWECDPFGNAEAIVWPMLGKFPHEAAAVDPVHGVLYLTEDEPDGRFYRFVPDRELEGRLDFESGTLQVMQVEGGTVGAVTWLDVPDPALEDEASPPTRKQVPASTAFDGGEGIFFYEGAIYFTTKGDNRVWRYDTEAESLSLVYDAADYDEPILTGVDNITISGAGDILVAEDPGDHQVVAITPDGDLVPIVQVVGHPESEITGPAFDPYRKRLYFSSQRGESGDVLGTGGVTYEMTGPFFV